MSKVLFCGDFHITPRQPSSRKDNYQETLIQKIKSIKKVVLENEVEHLVFLGDMFNTNQMTLSYFSKVFPLFKEISSITKIYTCIGNHDILYNTEDTISESPIHLLKEAHIIEDAHKIELDDVVIHIEDFLTLTSDLKQIEKTQKHTILVGHYFYVSGFEDIQHTLTKEQCKNLGYVSYILGHDHTVYEPIINKVYQVHRPGSLTRSSVEKKQVFRDNIQVILLDTKTQQYNYLNLPHIQPSKDIFLETRLLEKLNVSSITESMQTFLDALDFGEEQDIFKVLDSMDIDKKVKETIVSYLNMQGLYK